MKSIFKNLLDSFNNKAIGWSGKKITACSIVLCCVVAHIKWIALADFSQLIMVLGTDYAFILTLFGINEYGKKNDKQTIIEDNGNV